MRTDKLLLLIAAISLLAGYASPGPIAVFVGFVAGVSFLEGSRLSKERIAARLQKPKRDADVLEEPL